MRALNPAGIFQPVQDIDQSRLFNPEARGDLRLSNRLLGEREMEQCSPLRLAHPERLEPLVQLEPPGPRRPVQQRSEILGVDLAHGIVSMLTISLLSIAIRLGFQAPSTTNTTTVWSR